MNSLFGTSFGFLTPQAFLAAPLILGLLVYAYLRRGQGTRVPVATLLILHKLRRVSTSRKKFVPPFRFFFELALLALMLAGVAGLFREDSRRNVALLIDNSLSMAARDPSQVGGGSLLQSARERAGRLLQNLPDDAGIDLYVSSPLLRSLTDGLTSKRRAAVKLEAVEPAYAGDNLDAALSRLSNSPLYNRIVAFTSRPVSGNGAFGGKAEALDSRVEVQSLIPEQSRQALQNVAISGVTWRGGSPAVKERQLTASVDAYTAQQVQVAVRLEAIGAGGVAAVAAEKKLVLEPNGRAGVVFDGLADSAAAFSLKLRVDSPAAPALDLLREDNAAWITAQGGAAKAAFVGDLSPRDLGLDRIRAVSFSHLPPAQYEAELAGGRLETEGLFVFHHYVPPALPPAGALFIAPPPGNRLLPVGAEIESAEITRWQPAHPVANYLKFPALALKRVTPLEIPPWAHELLSTTAGPVVAAGEEGGRRYLIVGFEILPYEGLRAPILSVFTLNAFNWLSAGAISVGYQPVNTPLNITPDIDSVSYLKGAELYRRQAVKVPGQTVQSVVLGQTGLVRVLGDGGKVSYVAVNFFDEQESNLLAAAPIALPAQPAGRADSRQKNLLVPGVALAAFALCMLEILVITGFFGLRARREGETV